MIHPSPLIVKDIFLNPGDFFFGIESSRVRTLLGSCVSIILWSSERKIGGMCHYLLPSRYDSRIGQKLDGKYAEEAFELFQQNAKYYKIELHDFQAKIFGGSDMFSREESILANVSNAGSPRLVGQRNIEIAKNLLGKHKIPIVSESTGGSHHRRIYFTIWDGEVYVESSI